MVEEVGVLADLSAQKAGHRKGAGLRRAEKLGRTRQCVVTRNVLPEAELIRFVADPDGLVIPDLKAVLPGRGAWVRAERSLVEKAAKGPLIGALKADQKLIGLDDLAARTDEALAGRATGSIGLARKAGLIVTGFAKVEAAIKAGHTLALLHAVEAAPDGSGKLDRLAGHHGTASYRVLSTQQLGLALGAENVIHAALLKGPGADNFLAPVGRLAVYRAAGGEGSQAGAWTRKGRG